MKDAYSTNSEGVEEAVSKLLGKLGYAVTYVNVSGKCVTFKANASRGGVEEQALVVAYSRKGKIGDAVLTSVMADVSEQHYTKALVFSRYGFTEKAVAYAQDKPIELIDAEEYERLLVKYGLAVGTRKEREDMFVYEFAFTPGLTEEQARMVFATQRRRLFAFFGPPTETVSEVSGRFAPVARIATLVCGKPKSFFINLNNGSLYFVRRDVIRKTTVLEGARFIEIIAGLEDEMVAVLGEVVCHGQIPMSEVAAESGLALKERMRTVLRLKARKLIDVMDRGEPILLSNVNLPNLKDDRFDLERLFETRERLETTWKADDITYSVDALERMLSLFFGGEARVEKVGYLPYYRTAFVDGKSRVRSGFLNALRGKRTVRDG